jgi:hypothetical protein
MPFALFGQSAGTLSTADAFSGGGPANAQAIGVSQGANAFFGGSATTLTGASAGSIAGPANAEVSEL